GVLLIHGCVRSHSPDQQQSDECYLPMHLRGACPHPWHLVATRHLSYSRMPTSTKRWRERWQLKYATWAKPVRQPTDSMSTATLLRPFLIALWHACGKRSLVSAYGMM